MIVKASDFLGRWHLERRVEDALSGRDATFSGTAEITEQGDHWLYAETGKLQMHGTKPMTAARRYMWHPKTNAIDVFFEDGRFFHQISLADAASAAHWCDPDQYDVVYNFATWPKWSNTWAVSGPNKKYVMKSAYRPL